MLFTILTATAATAITHETHAATATGDQSARMAAGTNVMIRARAAFLACRFDENPHAGDTQDLPAHVQACSYPLA